MSARGLPHTRATQEGDITMSEREAQRWLRELFANPVAFRLLDHLYRDQPMPQADRQTIAAAFDLLECHDLIRPGSCAPELTAKGRQLMAVLIDHPRP